VEAHTHAAAARKAASAARRHTARRFAQRKRTKVARDGRIEMNQGTAASERAEVRTIPAQRTLFVHIGVLLRHAGCLLLRKEKRSRPISRVLSRTIIHLRYASPRTSSDLPGSLCGPHVLPHPRTGPLAPLFGLAPGGVCRATECCHRRGALLPHPFTLTAPFAGGLAVCFLLHFPWAHAPQALPGALPWEPGLSSTLARSDCLADSGRDGGGCRERKQGESQHRSKSLCRCCGAQFPPFFSPGTA
jgi:hypothetical protein